MTLDIEHYMKVFIINSVASNPNEDGYEIINAYRASLGDKALSSLDGELNIRKNDVYCGEPIRKYHAGTTIPFSTDTIC